MSHAAQEDLEGQWAPIFDALRAGAGESRRTPRDRAPLECTRSGGDAASNRRRSAPLDPERLKSRIGLHRAEALALDLTKAAREALARSTWSQQPRFSCSQIDRAQPQSQSHGHELARSEGSAIRLDHGDERSERVMVALIRGGSPGPSMIRAALSQAWTLTPSAEVVWLRTGLDKWTADRAARRALLHRKNGAVDREGSPVRAAEPDSLPSPSHVRAAATYERFAALPLPTRRRSGALAAAADIHVRHLGSRGTTLALRAVELDPDWIYPHIVLLTSALLENNRELTELGFSGLQESRADAPIESLLEGVTLDVELPPWARDVHPALQGLNDQGTRHQ